MMVVIIAELAQSYMAQARSSGRSSPSLLSHSCMSRNSPAPEQSLSLVRSPIRDSRQALPYQTDEKPGSISSGTAGPARGNVGFPQLSVTVMGGTGGSSFGPTSYLHTTLPLAG